MLKKDKRLAIQSLIDSVPLGSAFNYAQLARFNALTGWGALAAIHARNPTHPRDPRHVRSQFVEGGPFVARSWRKAISPVGDDTRLMRACRFAVSDQMQEWLVRQDRRCVKCGSDRDPTADHIEVPFVDMVTQWAADRAAQELLRQRTESEANSGAGALLLPGPWREWRSWHEQRAQYQVLCRSCNAAKGAGHD